MTERDRLDLILAGGSIVDGTGSPARKSDIGVRDGRIVAVGELSAGRARRVLDLRGLTIAPGFIDTHGHSDFGITVQPGAESQVAQGVTTEIAGNCGGSAFPISEAGRSLHFSPRDVKITWRTAAEYFRTLEERSPAINVASLLGHSALRAAVMGMAERAPTAAELDEMRTLLREALDAGAVGLSFGGHFAPSCYGQVDELTALCRDVRSSDGVYAVHLRDYGRDLLRSVDETLAIADATDVRVHIALLKPFGRTFWGQLGAAQERLAEARQRGRAVSCETMAYSTAGAWWGPRAVFPAELYDWRTDDLEGLIRQLGEPSTRRRIAALVEERRRMPKHGFSEEYLIFNDWRDIVVEGVRAGSTHATLVGRSIADVAAERGAPPVEIFFDLLIAEGRELSTVNYQVSEDEHVAVLVDPWSTVGIDGIATSPETVSAPINRIQQHPRHWGTFPHVLGHYVRERQLLTLEEAVRKMTSLPAQVMGLRDRGVVRAGAWADLVVFDPTTIAAGGTWREPVRYPVGIEYVLVNGRVAVERGRPTGERAGRSLRRAAEVPA